VGIFYFTNTPLPLHHFDAVHQHYFLAEIILDSQQIERAAGSVCARTFFVVCDFSITLKPLDVLTYFSTYTG